MPFEFLIEDYTNCKDKFFADVERRVVDLGGLIEEYRRAIDDGSVRIAVYEIHRLRSDWTLPRTEAPTAAQEGDNGETVT